MIAIVVIFCAGINVVYGQVTQGGNIRPATGTPFPFLGWNNVGTAGTLEIRNDFTNHINFFTDGTQKMTILGTNDNEDGNVGIGLVAPKARLHVVSANQLVGTLSQSLVPGTGFNMGVWGTATNSTTNIGGEFNAYGSAGRLYGVRGNAGQGFNINLTGNFSFGGFFESNNTNGLNC